MKDEELLKIILDLQVDNIRQNRELFKHIAILSSAIISIFAFNSNQHIDDYAKNGVVGLFITIIISVLIIFLSLWQDNEIIKKVKKLSNNIRKLKDEAKNNAIKEIISDESIAITKDFIRKILTEEELGNSEIDKINAIFGKFWANITANDQKIEEEKADLLDRTKNKWKVNIINGIAILGVILFLVSLGFILSSIMVK